MSKLLKNTTVSAINIGDTGVSIPASPGSYLIPPQDYPLWTASDDVVVHIGSGDLVANDGNVDLDPAAGIALIQGNYVSHTGIRGVDGTLASVIDDAGVKRLAVDISGLTIGEAITVEDDGSPLTVNVNKFNFLSPHFQITEPLADDIDIDLATLLTSTGAPDANRIAELDSGGRFDGSFIDEADDQFTIKHPTDSDFDLIFQSNSGASPFGASISKAGASGFIHYMPNAETAQITVASPTAAVGVNRMFFDIDNGGDLYLQTLPGAGASGEIIATDGAPLRPDNDGTSDLGRADRRWKDFYSVSGKFTEGVGAGVTASTLADNVVIESDQVNAGMSILAATGGNANLYFGNTDDGNNASCIQYVGSVDELRLLISNMQKVRISSTLTRLDNDIQLLAAQYQQAGLLVTDSSGNVSVEDPKNNALSVGNIGSASNAANQNFQIDLSSFGIKVGDSIRLGNALVRGDLSSDGTEYIDVGFGTAVAPKIRLGENGYDDTATFRTDGGLIDQTETVVDIGGGTPGLQVYVSPSAAVNFSPGGMPNLWWWQFKIDILIA